MRGVGEALPFRDGCLGAVLSVAVFEFLPAPVETMREVARVLRPGGRVIVGFFPRGSAWAAAYEKQGRDPRSVFHDAHFLPVEEVESLAASVGLQPYGTRGTLFEAPGAVPTGRVVEYSDTGAGFVACAFTKPSTARSGSR
jgi:SAM-dependent methyltransferase